ncbi:MAG: response regulator [Acidobacteria bacterium]|nr:response regulator [Acidobacteriota bacterium]
MAEKSTFAVLVHDRTNPIEPLKVLLKGQAVETWSAKTCDEVARLLDQTQPELVITDTRLQDGTWVDVINLAEKAAVPTNVIVVGSHDDTKLYITAMQNGAFDFILPPFEVKSVAHVLRVAVDNVRHRREELFLKAVS